MFPAHSEPYVSSHLLAFRTSQVSVSSGKSGNDLGLPEMQCWGLVLKESLQTLPKSLRRAGKLLTGPAEQESWKDTANTV